MRGSFEEQLAALVEIPSVSMEPERRSDLGRCADLAVEYLRGDRRRGPAPGHRGPAAGHRQAARRSQLADDHHLQPPGRATGRSRRVGQPAVQVHPRGRTGRSALVRPRHHRRQGPGADRHVRRQAGRARRRAGQPAVPVGAGRGDRQPALRAGPAGRPGRGFQHRRGGGVRHHLAVGGAAGAALRSARPDGLHRQPEHRGQGRALRHHRRRRPQPDRRAVPADRRVPRRPHRPGEDPRLLRRRPQAEPPRNGRACAGRASRASGSRRRTS